MVPSIHLNFHIHRLPPTEASAARLFLVLCSSLHAGTAGHLTFPLHAHDQALLVATVLAAVALALVDETIFVIPARVDEVFSYGSFEEAFAAFATVHTVVLSWFTREQPLDRSGIHSEFCFVLFFSPQRSP